MANSQSQVVKKKLSYKLQRELDSLPELIEQLETDIGELEKLTLAPNFYEQEYNYTQPVLDELAQKNQQLEQAMERWSELED